MRRQHWLALTVLALVIIAAGCGTSSRPRGSGGSETEIRPGSPSQQMAAFANLGRVLLSQGELAGAMVQLSKAEAIDPQNPDVLTLLGMTYYSRGEYDKALEYLRRALAVDPSKTEVHNNIGLVNLDLKLYDQARREFEICLNDPTYTNSHLPLLNLGQLEEAEGNTGKAEEYYRRIITLNPQFPPAYYRLARIYDLKGLHQQAVDYLLNAVRLNPNYVDAFYLLGEVYEKLNLTDESAESYGQVVVLSPNTPMALDAQRRARRVLGYE